MRRLFIHQRSLWVGCFVMWTTWAGCRSDVHSYRPPAREEVVTVSAADLGLSNAQSPTLGIRVLDEAASVGRFPTGLSVVQVYAAKSVSGGMRHIQAYETAGERSAAWGGLSTEVPALREVCLQRSRALDPRGSQWRDILRRAREDDCNLCLIYSRIDTEESDAAYLAALWDTMTPKALASYRVAVTIAECRREEPKGEEYPKPRRKMWLYEAEYRAETDLRELVLGTLWELASRDTPTKGTRPNPWESDRPLFPRVPPSELRDVELRTQR